MGDKGDLGNTTGCCLCHLTSEVRESRQSSG